MISEAKNVTDYLKEVPEKRKAALTKLRKLCKEILVGYEETMAYGEPTYKKDKGIEIGFASQKNQICFYCLVHQVMLDNKENLKGLNHGKGVIRFSSPPGLGQRLIPQDEITGPTRRRYFALTEMDKGIPGNLLSADNCFYRHLSKIKQNYAGKVRWSLLISISPHRDYYEYNVAFAG